MPRATRFAPAFLLAVAACASATPGAKSSPAAAAPVVSAPPATVVGGAEAHRLVAAGVKVVDVRRPDEFATGHVPGAVNIPYDEMPARAQELGDPAGPVLVYCHSGRRSGLAIQTLREKGFTRIYDMKRYEVWTERQEGAVGR